MNSGADGSPLCARPLTSTSSPPCDRGPSRPSWLRERTGFRARSPAGARTLGTAGHSGRRNELLGAARDRTKRASFQSIFACSITARGHEVPRDMMWPVHGPSLLRCRISVQPMSQLGLTRPSPFYAPTSASANCGHRAALAVGSYVPRAKPYRPQQILPLFNHLVGALLEKQRYVYAEGVCRLEIDHQLEFRGLLYWYLRRFITLQNFMHKESAATKQGRAVGTV